MAINARAVIRVIIEGEWIWVERGTFTVIDFQFEDDDGNVLNKGREPAYFFMSTNGDPYFGPLSSLSLIKLDNQVLEESGGEVADKVRMRALGPGDADEDEDDGADDDAAGESDAEHGDGSGDDDAGDRPAVPLFAGDADASGEEDATDTKEKTGLF